MEQGRHKGLKGFFERHVAHNAGYKVLAFLLAVLLWLIARSRF